MRSLIPPESVSPIESRGTLVAVAVPTVTVADSEPTEAVKDPRPDPSVLFELDDEITSEGRDPVELAHELRADVAVIVDSYHALQANFLDTVFASVGSGAASVQQYGWRIVRKQTS
jgi:hypothetical protein